MTTSLRAAWPERRQSIGVERRVGSARGGQRDDAWTLQLILMVAVVLFIRSRWFGNPLVSVDEQFYLLGGDRLLHGAVPFVDFWDRKPVGLFLLFAGIRLLGGDGVIQYQLVAAGVVAATSVVIAVLGRRIGPRHAALAAGVVYPLAFGMSGGSGGQAPVFYNLPVAIAALCVVETIRRRHAGLEDGRALLARGAWAMVLVGLAIQIKYTVLFEGLFFGLVLLHECRRRDWSAAETGAAAVLWAGIALSPTLAAALVYAVRGQLDAFVFANFVSIGLRVQDPWPEQFHQLLLMLLRLAPFLIALVIEAALAAGGRSGPEGCRETRLFVLGWAMASAVAILVFGTYFDHYVLSLLVPLSVAIVPVLGEPRRSLGLWVGAVVLGSCGADYLIQASRLERRHGTRAYAEAISTAVRSHLSGGCLYVFYGEPILYELSGACAMTRWSFPYHLSLSREAPALGVRPAEELRRIMRRRPTVVVDTLGLAPERNEALHRLLRNRLSADYHLAGQWRVGRDVRQLFVLDGSGPETGKPEKQAAEPMLADRRGS